MAKIDRMLVGEALVGDGNEVAHIDLIIGPRGTPAETAFALTLTNQKEGVNALLAVLEPNLMVKPATVMFNKVTIKNAKQAVQMFGPAQAAVARAVVDSVVEGVIPKDKAEEWCIVCGVFIDPNANDNKKIYKNNYEATKLAIRRALQQKPTIDEIIAQKETKHPFE